jgi:hypothetical protein
MLFSRLQLSLAVAGVFFCTGELGFALVLYGPDTGGATNNLIAPTNGAPWEYVVGIDGVAASGVYLGYGYVLTANHVTGPLASVSISGVTYSTDPAYVPFRIDGADLKLLRLLEDPGLAPLPLIGANDDDTGKTATIIGYGLGKGTEIPNQGWNWGDESTRMQRWGLNTTGAVYTQSDGLSYLTTDFDRPSLIGGFGDDEVSLANGDSGGGLFIKYGNTWKLAGVVSAVSTTGQSLYDTDPTDLLDTPSIGFYTPVKLYRNEIIAAIPEPSAAAMIGIGALLVFAKRRRRKLQ